MAYTAKNITTGSDKNGVITISFGGTDLGALKADSMYYQIDRKIHRLGDSESFVGFVEAMREVKSIKIGGILQENTLANIKLVADLTDAVGGTNPATLNLNYDYKVVTSGAVVLTYAAPRTTAGVAQTNTLTLADAFSSIEQIKTALSRDKISEIPFEFEALLGSSQEASWSAEAA